MLQYRLRSFILGSLLTVVSVCASASTFHQVDVQGSIRVPEKNILEQVKKIMPSHQASPKDIQKLIKSLYAMDWFADIQVKVSHDVLYIVVKERPTIVSFSLVNAKLLPEEASSQIRDGLNLKVGKPYDPSAMKRFVGVVLNRYREMGYGDVTVSHEQEILSDNRVKVKVIVSKAKAKFVDEIAVEGNKSISKYRLMYEVGLAKPKIFSRLLGGAYYSELALEHLQETIKEYYRGQGFLDAKIVNVRVVPLTSTGVKVLITIDEGKRYMVTSLSVRGDDTVQDRTIKAVTSAQKEIASKQGLVFSREWLDVLKQKVTNELENGGAQYTVQVDVRVASEHALAVVIDAQKAPEKRIRYVEFIGNRYTLDHVLRREVLLREGDVLLSSKLHDTVSKIARLGYVKNVRSQVVPVSDGVVDVMVYLEEASTASANLEFSVNQNGNPQLTASFNHANLMGTGNPVKLEASRGRESTVFALSGAFPYALQNGTGLDYSMYYKLKSNKPFPFFPKGQKTVEDFKRNQQVGLDLGVQVPSSLYQSLSLSGGFSHTVSQFKAKDTNNKAESDAETTDDNDTQTAAEATDKKQELLVPRYFKLSSSVTWQYNSLDRFLYPTSGMNHKIRTEYGFPLGRTQVDVNDKAHSPFLHFWKTQWDASFYRGFFNESFVINPRFSLGYGRMFNKIVCGSEDACQDVYNIMPQDERFFAGGEHPVRGYNVIGPSTTVDGRTVAAGGNVLSTASINVLFPPLMQDSVMVSGFLDGGYVFGRTGAVNRFELEPLRFSKWLYSAGVQVQVNTPMAPLLFILSRPLPLHKKEQGGFEKFQFTIRAGL